MNNPKYGHTVTLSRKSINMHRLESDSLQTCVKHMTHLETSSLDDWGETSLIKDWWLCAWVCGFGAGKPCFGIQPALLPALWPWARYMFLLWLSVPLSIKEWEAYYQPSQAIVRVKVSSQTQPRGGAQEGWFQEEIICSHERETRERERERERETETRETETRERDRETDVLLGKRISLQIKALVIKVEPCTFLMLWPGYTVE